MGSRTTQIDVIRKIFQSLDPLDSLMMKDLVNRTGLSPRTLRRYIKLIEVVQSQPKLEVEKTGHEVMMKLAGYTNPIPVTIGGKKRG